MYIGTKHEVWVVNCSGGENKQVQRTVWCSVSELSSELDMYICVFTALFDVMMAEDCARLPMHGDSLPVRRARRLQSTARPCKLHTDRTHHFPFIFFFHTLFSVLLASYCFTLFLPVFVIRPPLVWSKSNLLFFIIFQIVSFRLFRF